MIFTTNFFLLERNFYRRIDDVSLGTRLKERDPRLLNELFDAYGASLYGIIYRVVNHEKVAEEVLQETFRTVWKEAETYNAQKITFFTWIMAVARKLARERMAAEQGVQAQPVHGTNYPEQVPATNRQKETIRNLLDKLSSEEREVVQLVVFSGYTSAEVARQLNVSVDITRKHLRVASLKIREILQPSS